LFIKSFSRKPVPTLITFQAQNSYQAGKNKLPKPDQGRMTFCQPTPGRMAQSNQEELVVLFWHPPTYCFHPSVFSVVNEETDQTPNAMRLSPQTGSAKSERLLTSIRRDLEPRSLGRPGILDLPDELLMDIFKHAEGGSEVRNIRLACRRFCSTRTQSLEYTVSQVQSAIASPTINATGSFMVVRQVGPAGTSRAYRSETLFL
jgi:hypothetical protein